MTYDRTFTRLTDGLCYSPVPARGLLLAAKVRGTVTDAGTTITCTHRAPLVTDCLFRITRDTSPYAGR